MNFLFEDTKQQTAEEQEELFKALTEKALHNEHNKFEFIKTITEVRIMIATKHGLYKILNLYNLIIKNLYKEYCKQVLLGTADFNLLYALRQYKECKVFYETELKTVQDMLGEYEAYISRGHFLDQWLFGRTRESWQLWDHRWEGPYGN